MLFKKNPRKLLRKFRTPSTCSLPSSSQTCNIPKRHSLTRLDDSQTSEIDSSSCYLKLCLLRLTQTCKPAIQVSHTTPASMKPGYSRICTCYNTNTSDTQHSLPNPFCGSTALKTGLCQVFAPMVMRLYISDSPCTRRTEACRGSGSACSNEAPSRIPTGCSSRREDTFDTLSS